MEDLKLKPCPFCGVTPYIERKPLWREYAGTYRGYKGCFEYVIQCHECGCNIKLNNNDTIYRNDKEARQNAIEAWNRRADIYAEEVSRK